MLNVYVLGRKLSKSCVYIVGKGLLKLPELGMY